MNEFTKEELQLILKSIWWGGSDDDTELLQKLDDKIQSMIDNYCNHECQEIRDANSIASCPKCGKHHE